MGRLAWVVLLGLTLGGCVTNKRPPDDISGESAKMKWVGASRDELVAAYGQPQQVLDTTLLGRASTEAYLYQATDGSGCTDAFTITVNSGEITDYFCR